MTVHMSAGKSRRGYLRKARQQGRMKEEGAGIPDDINVLDILDLHISVNRPQIHPLRVVADKAFKESASMVKVTIPVLHLSKLQHNRHI